jgi:hypothetical protein
MRDRGFDRQPTRLRLVLALLAAGAAPPLHAVLVPLDGPRPLGGTHCEDREREPALAPLADGSVAAFWITDDRLLFRPLQADGSPHSAPRVIASGEPRSPVATVLPGGGLAVVWHDRSRGQVLARWLVGGAEQEIVIGAAGPDPGSGFGGVAVAATPWATLAVAWTDGHTVLVRELRADGSALTPPHVVASDAGGSGYTSAYFDPVLFVGGDLALRVYWVAGLYQPQPSASGVILGRRVPAAGAGGHGPGTPLPFFEHGHHPAVAPLEDGAYVLAWSGRTECVVSPPPPGCEVPAVFAQRVGADDQPVGEHPLRVDGGSWEGVGATALAEVGDDTLVVAWEGVVEGATPEVHIRALDLAGAPIGSPRAIAEPAAGGQVSPALVSGPSAPVLAAWQDAAPPHHPGPCGADRIQARPFRRDDGAGGSFAVGGGRFELALSYFDPRRGLSGTAQGVALTDDAGYFWFFAPDNVEAAVKVLDGSGVNGHHWVFFGGLTDLGFDLEVADTLSGRRRTFTSPPGELASRGATDALPAGAAKALEPFGVEVRRLRRAALVRDAFPSGIGRAGSPGRPASSFGPTVITAPLSPPLPSPCGYPGTPGLCLNGQRFDVLVDWRTPDGTTGQGHGVALGDDSGYFWFFDPANVELFLKVLDGRPVNGKFWVFYAALSDVEYSIHVAHRASWTGTGYHNPPGRFASVADTDALTPPIPPHECRCPEIFAPVCGADGRTYQSACQAECEGWVVVAHHGPCP